LLLVFERGGIEQFRPLSLDTSRIVSNEAHDQATNMRALPLATTRPEQHAYASNKSWHTHTHTHTEIRGRSELAGTRTTSNKNSNAKILLEYENLPLLLVAAVIRVVASLAAHHHQHQQPQLLACTYLFSSILVPSCCSRLVRCSRVSLLYRALLAMIGDAELDSSIAPLPLLQQRDHAADVAAPHQPNDLNHQPNDLNLNHDFNHDDEHLDNDDDATPAVSPPSLPNELDALEADAAADRCVASSSSSSLSCSPLVPSTLFSDAIAAALPGIAAGSLPSCTTDDLPHAGRLLHSRHRRSRHQHQASEGLHHDHDHDDDDDDDDDDDPVDAYQEGEDRRHLQLDEDAQRRTRQDEAATNATPASATTNSTSSVAASTTDTAALPPSSVTPTQLPLPIPVSTLRRRYVSQQQQLQLHQRQMQGSLARDEHADDGDVDTDGMMAGASPSLSPACSSTLLVEFHRRTAAPAPSPSLDVDVDVNVSASPQRHDSEAAAVGGRSPIVAAEAATPIADKPLELPPSSACSDTADAEPATVTDAPLSPATATATANSNSTSASLAAELLPTTPPLSLQDSGFVVPELDHHTGSTGDARRRKHRRGAGEKLVAYDGDDECSDSDAEHHHHHHHVYEREREIDATQRLASAHWARDLEYSEWEDYKHADESAHATRIRITRRRPGATSPSLGSNKSPSPSSTSPGLARSSATGAAATPPPSSPELAAPRPLRSVSFASAASVLSPSPSPSAHTAATSSATSTSTTASLLAKDTQSGGITLADAKRMLKLSHETPEDEHEAETPALGDELSCPSMSMPDLNRIQSLRHKRSKSGSFTERKSKST